MKRTDVMAYRIAAQQLDRAESKRPVTDAAIFDFGGGWELKGWVAWFFWAFIHIYLLVGFEHRLLVSVQWLWRYLTYEQGARLIVDEMRKGQPSIAPPAE